MKQLMRLLPLLRPYSVQFVWAFLTLALVVGVDLLIPMQIGRLIDNGIALNNGQAVFTATLWMVGLALFGMLMTYLNTLFAVRIAESVAADIREEAYRQTQTFSVANLDALTTGELLVRLTNDVNQIKSAVSLVLRMVFRAPLMFVGALLILIITSPTLSLTLAVLLPITLFVILWYSGKTEPLYRAVQTQLDRLNTVLSENLAGVRVVKAFVREQWEQARYARANDDYTAVSIEVNQLVVLLMPTMLLLINLGTVAIIYLGGNLAIAGDVLTTGELVAFVNYLAITVFPIVMLGMVLPQVYAANASAERLFDVIDQQPTVVDTPSAQPHVIKHGRICFENVAFDYDGEVEANATLTDISFVAEAGETVAILGATGAGKTTLVTLVARLYDVVRGRITIDGIDVRDFTQTALRQQIGFALQEAMLFSGTVADNIRYGNPSLSDEAVIVAATAAQAHDFIIAKPDGYQARVEQRGTNFSGGQKQRLAIARALAIRPKILLLDDSTSAVDVTTEANIQAALATVTADTTTLIVAQRIRSVLTADKILVLDNGRIVANGTHVTLLDDSPIYREIYQSQME